MRLQPETLGAGVGDIQLLGGLQSGRADLGGSAGLQRSSIHLEGLQSGRVAGSWMMRCASVFQSGRAFGVLG